jgi:hypothetical protein
VADLGCLVLYVYLFEKIYSADNFCRKEWFQSLEIANNWWIVRRSIDEKEHVYFDHDWFILHKIGRGSIYDMVILLSKCPILNKDWRPALFGARQSSGRRQGRDGQGLAVPASPGVASSGVAGPGAQVVALSLGVRTRNWAEGEARGSATAFEVAVRVRVALLELAGAASRARVLSVEGLNGVDTAESAGRCQWIDPYRREHNPFERKETYLLSSWRMWGEADAKAENARETTTVNFILSEVSSFRVVDVLDTAVLGSEV